MAMVNMIEAIHQPDLSVICDPIEQLEQLLPEQRPSSPFYFTNPEWLRVGRHVQVEWISTDFTPCNEDVFVSNDAEGYTFSRQQLLRNDSHQVDRGIIVKAMSEDSSSITFSPYRRLAPNQFGALTLHSPAAKMIVLDTFDSYIFSAVSRREQVLQRSLIAEHQPATRR